MSNKLVKAISTDSAPPPVGPYNQAVIAGDWLFCSGQIALNPISGEMVGNGEIEAETRQVLKNLLAVLKEAGAETSQVIKATIYLADLSDFTQVNSLYGEVFGEGISPARACVEVSALPKNARVEIECIAFLGAKSQ
ncbi:Rid family detoxifying hydrolase [Prochlorococcus sp. MIT 1341]|uniref:Rid family detoxifying hydrolase n=1 Tax=Prochlorococcus sp. MIT 1341 TaxID=3096221 RepID=UPI002A762DC7|nr:Rid family detoxifying hydrolase [Prochlorococcus sp. MIT 1341]